ncbi:hypothetical protein SNEBB_008576 [Seison nebaliae]|nr:hypothetical protein SNEBB_008576 [Seison nebaliae]
MFYILFFIFTPIGNCIHHKIIKGKNRNIPCYPTLEQQVETLNVQLFGENYELNRTVRLSIIEAVNERNFPARRFCMIINIEIVCFNVTVPPKFVALLSINTDQSFQFETDVQILVIAANE